MQFQGMKCYEMEFEGTKSMPVTELSNEKPGDIGQRVMALTWQMV